LLPLLRLTPLWGASIIQNFTINTSLYIPAVLSWGVLADYLLEQAASRSTASRRWQFAPVAALIVGLAIRRVPAVMGVLDRGYDLASRPDMRAVEWIKQSLPQSSFFLINGIVYTDKITAVEGDAGWWLPLLTGRGVTILPQYALVAEQSDRSGYSDAVNGLVRCLFEVSPTSPEGHQAICEFPQPITHVYLGQRGGTVAKAIQPPPRPMLPPEQMLADPAFRLVYSQDHAMIFEFDRSVCS
jgi:hypothetical protein